MRNHIILPEFDLYFSYFGWGYTSVIVGYRAIDKCAHQFFLTDKYDKIPSSIESKLLSFQREGIR